MKQLIRHQHETWDRPLFSNAKDGRLDSLDDITSSARFMRQSPDRACERA